MFFLYLCWFVILFKEIVVVDFFNFRKCLFLIDFLVCGVFVKLNLLFVYLLFLLIYLCS